MIIPVAERRFRTRNGTAVVARLYAPERMAQSSEWSCKINLAGLEEPYEQIAIGVDSFQALCLGLRLLCAEIDKRAPTLSFLDGSEGYTGTPLILPWSYSGALKAQVHRMINEKVKEELDAIDHKRRGGPGVM